MPRSIMMHSWNQNDKSDSGASNDNVKDVLPIAYKAKGTDAIKETFLNIYH